jgi:DNA ligase-1
MTLRREFLQLADTYKPAKHTVAGLFISEKLDGTRCFWDGGLSRGCRTEEVPWASITDPKTGRKKAKIKPVATGLWSRYGNPIMAPDWFLNQLPACPLDGELWAGRGNFQLCRSICAGDEPDPRFDKIVYAAYSCPPLAAVFRTGEIKNANMVVAIDHTAIEHWIRERLKKFGGDFRDLTPGAVFTDEMEFIQAALDNTPLSICYLHQQTKLSDDPVEAAAQVETHLERVLDLGGEGVVIRDPQACWIPKRHKQILKHKPYHDAESVVTGFTSGRLTDKGSKHLGKIGALITNFKGKRLELSGLKDVERLFLSDEMREYAEKHPGEDMPDSFQGKHFKVGQTVTFKYRELSDDGIPKEGRYWRRRDVE